MLDTLATRDAPSSNLEEAAGGVGARGLAGSFDHLGGLV
jgi:hypothetical protein